MSIRLGDVAPNFTQDSTEGPIDFYQWSAGQWTVLFSHPKDFTPVCTTELGAVARLKPEFDKRGVKAIGLSVDPLTDHKAWAVDIRETQGSALNFPLLADADKKVSLLYGFIHPNASDTFTVRSVVIIDPNKKVRLLITYPASTGRNFTEILRVIDSLQLTDKYKVATPVDWKQGDDVIIIPALKDEEEIKRLFPDGYKAVKPYLRITPNPLKTAVTALMLFAVSLVGGLLAHAEDAPVPAQTVEQRLAILERKYENDQEAAAAKAKSDASVQSSKDGFFIKSNDGAYSLRLGGYVQADYRDYQGDHGSTQFNDQFLLRRVRTSFDGTLAKNVIFKITTDFANGGGTTAGPTSSLLPDAYLELQYVSAAKLRFGKIKPPFGLENIQSDPVMFFIERSLATQLVPIRDAGAQVSGDFFSNRLSYQAAITNGVVDATNGETDSNDGKDYLGRLFLQPFKTASSEWVNGLGFGIAGSIGDQFGNTTTSNLTAGYRTDGQQTFFTYQANTFANGQRKRISPQGYWYTSHFGILGEYVASSQEIRRVVTSTGNATVTNRAWQIAGSYVITGERPSFNGVKPRKIFDPKNGGWGALEVVGRYAIFRVDDEAFSRNFASISSSAKKAKSWSSGLNWYLNNNVRIASNYAVTSFLGGAAAGANRPTEKVVLSRVQITY